MADCVFDRIENLLEQGDVAGIDFIHVDEDQTTLKVHFHLKRVAPPALPATTLSGLSKDDIEIYQTKQGEGQGTVGIDEIQWIASDTVLKVITTEPGGFANYTFHIEDNRIDPLYNDVVFSFKVNCDSDLDCKSKAHECPDEESVDFPIDYQARDFWSIRQALLDFASLRYPDWQDRLEADAGIMLAEVMSALGDEMSYYQDRVAREAYLETATQQRSLRHHARLVDYEIHDGLTATTWLDITVNAGFSDDLIAGSDVWAQSDKGDEIYYEVGSGLEDILAEKKYDVDAAINSLTPHIWDEDHQCLPVGATEVCIEGQFADELAFNDTTADDLPFRWILLKTNPTDPSVRERRWMVQLIHKEEIEDTLVTDPLCENQLTCLRWHSDQALPFEMDLATLEVRGNLVPATAGRQYSEYFLIGAEVSALLSLPSQAREQLTRGLERIGVNGSTMHLLSLADSDETPLCWLGEKANNAKPELKVFEVEWNGTDWQEKTGVGWEWRRSLMGVFASKDYERHYTIEDGLWRRLVGYRRIGKEIIHQDYASSDGKTIRFGDDEFGLVPDKNTIFKVVYRLGNGRVSNVAEDSITNFDSTAMSIVESITNPFAVENGLDPETPEEVKQLAPEAFRAVTYRAVRAEDYSEAAERLDWVQRAGTRMRWTGSWVSAFTTPDPYGAVSITEDQREEMATQMDRFRQAAREVYVPDPVYADIDLEIHICVQPYAYTGEVKEKVLLALVNHKTNNGFFSADNFTFGTFLRRSQLEATIQSVPGVRAVDSTYIRRRGYFDWQLLTGPYLPVGAHEVIRLENDPDYPDRGSLDLVMEGGA